MTPKQLLTADLNSAAETLRATSTAFAIATVVRTLNATSAKPGAKALVLPDGTITEGWIGGGCICRAVGRAAVEALRDGQPKFVSLRPGDVCNAMALKLAPKLKGLSTPKTAAPVRALWIFLSSPFCPNPRL
jgi:xanthine dehydrogenase accessory factor